MAKVDALEGGEDPKELLAAIASEAGMAVTNLNHLTGLSQCLSFRHPFLRAE
jgi:hypothetical protein